MRRVVPDRFTKGVSDGVALLSIHTAGWIRIVEVQGDSAVSTITHACDAVTQGDYLEKFEMPVVPARCDDSACAARFATRAVLTSRNSCGRCGVPLITASPVES